MEGKKVLIVDDIVDTGESMLSAKAYVEGRNPIEVRTASLQYMGCSKIDPDYVGERLEDWAWIVYPWNFMEDMISILTKCMKKDAKKRWSLEDLKHSLYINHAIDPIVLKLPSQEGFQKFWKRWKEYPESAPKQLMGKNTGNFYKTFVAKLYSQVRLITYASYGKLEDIYNLRRLFLSLPIEKVFHLKMNIKQ